MQRLTGKLQVWVIALALIAGVIAPLVAQAQTRPRVRTTRTSTVWNRGYNNGYPDGYRVGAEDYAQNAPRDHQRSAQWRDADRGYETRLGSLADYREGYRLGFELGYTDGYYGRPQTQQAPRNAGGMAARQRDRQRTDNSIPAETVLRLRLNTKLSTKTNGEGDRFTADVLEPTTYEGATVEGRIARIERSGRMTGHTEMALDFDAIVFRDGRRGAFYADIEKIYVGDSIRTADEEGNIDSAGKTRDIMIRSGGGAALGAVIGAIAKGGKGAAIGAIIGAGVGAGSVFIQGSRELILDKGTEMTVRTTGASRTGS